MDKYTSVPKFDVKICIENYRMDIESLLVQVKPEWSQGSIVTEEMNGGIINHMYCSWNTSNPEDKIVTRVYLDGNKFGDPNMARGFDRSREIKNLEKIRNLGLGPDLLALFTNGLCYKFLHGVTLNYETVQSEELIPKVTELLAKLNAQSEVDYETPWTIDKYEQIIEPFPPNLKDDNQRKRFFEIIPDRETLLKEIQQTIAKLPANSKMVYAHNDSKGENFIWNPKTNELRMVDFEHSGMNKQPYEIAAHFVSFTDVKNPTPKRYPSVEFQRKWIKSYLRYYNEAIGENPNDVTDLEVERMRVDVNLYSQILRLVLGVACLSLVIYDIFDSFEFCMLHLKEYFEYQQEVDALTAP